MGWGWSKTSPVTFEVGATGARACQVRREADGTRVIRDLHRTLLKPDETGEGEAVLRPEWVVPRLQRLLRQGRFSGNRVAILLSTPEVHHVALRLPPKVLEGGGSRLQDALRWEVARETRLAAELLEVRHWALPASAAQGNNTVAVAMLHEAAAGWFDACRAAGLDLVRLDVTSCALIRATIEQTPLDDHELRAVLDFGHRRAALIISVGGRPAYIRNLPIALDDWAEKLVDTLSISKTEALGLLHENGIRSLASDAAVGEDLSQIVCSVLRSPLASLVHEIERCAAYMLRSYRESTFRQLFLAGGGGLIPGLDQLLQSKLDVPVLPLGTGLAASGPPVDPVTAAVFGGALRGLEMT